ncbi:arginase family-domain-containing protein [Phyllosticta citrichinensis]|uniref:Arginase family-domain-containing protein n=1 Tax=Phyllosticta citrichinensis TaxID=1130410 RepID=A0ABR1XTZ7_9PEZI
MHTALLALSVAASLPLSTIAHGSHAHSDISYDPEVLKEKWGTDYGFTGISTFAHLPHVRCLTEPQTEFDIAILGAPFDTSVSYRPGARFGPRAIRAGSARQTTFRGYNPRGRINPYSSWAKILDCGDIPVTPFDNALALRQMSEAFTMLGTYSSVAGGATSSHLYRQKSKLVTLGGDHSIALPALRALKATYGQPIAVLHFDAHLDTWHPAKYPSAWIPPAEDFASVKETEGFPQSYFTHGSMFWLACVEGLVANGSSVHAGLRTRLAGDDEADWDDDSAQGWTRIQADDIDDIGTAGVIERIMTKIGTEVPVYLSVDIDVIDPGLAPGTGTAEPGGWTTRELIRVLRGVEGLNVVGADIVEVSPSYDGAGETTALAAAQVVYEIVTSMVKRGLVDEGKAEAEAEVGRDEL